MKAIFITLMLAVSVWSCLAQRNCPLIRAHPPALSVVTECQRTHMPARLLEIVTDCSSQHLGRTVTLEDFMTMLCNDDPDDLPTQNECLLEHVDYITENFELIEESAKRAEDCAKAHFRVTEYM